MVYIAFILAGGPVDVLLNNETNSCSEIKRVASFKTILAFTDLELIKSMTQSTR